jgi:hypothetical protein
MEILDLLRAATECDGAAKWQVVGDMPSWNQFFVGHDEVLNNDGPALNNYSDLFSQFCREQRHSESELHFSYVGGPALNDDTNLFSQLV